MPRADDLVADDVAFAERTAAMRAGVLAREEAFARVIERDAPLADRADACAADRKIKCFGDFNEIGHEVYAERSEASPVEQQRRILHTLHSNRLLSCATADPSRFALRIK